LRVQHFKEDRKGVAILQRFLALVDIEANKEVLQEEMV
jgi:hypothetical protein